MGVPSRSGDQREMEISVGTDNGFRAGHVPSQDEMSVVTWNLRDCPTKSIHSERLQGYGSVRSSWSVDVAHLKETIRCDCSDRDPKHKGLEIDLKKLYPILECDTSLIFC
jgi:hypothetical protein